MKLQVGVKALIKNQSDQFLFIRRAVTFGEEKQPHWDIPGGRIEANEPLLEALHREIMEETGLQFESMPKLLAAQDIFASHMDLHVVRLTYLIEGTGNPNLSDEHQEAKWMTIDEVLVANPDPYTREILERNL